MTDRSRSSTIRCAPTASSRTRSSRVAARTPATGSFPPARAARGGACTKSGSRAGFAITTRTRSPARTAARTCSRTPGCGTTFASRAPARSAERRVDGRGAGGAALARDARPQREVDLGAQLGESRRILAVALGELGAEAGLELGSAAASLPVLQEALGRLGHGIHADEPPRALHLADRVAVAALELDHMHLIAGKELEPMAKLLVVEATPGCVTERRQPHAVSALLRHSLQPRDRGAVARHRVATHDED